MSNRMAALERLEAAQQLAASPYICMHAVDYAALGDPVTPPEMRRAITSVYGLVGDRQKLYIGVCLCDPDETCRVCGDRALVA